MTRKRLVAEFIQGARGRILVVARLPPRTTGRSVLVVPPFAEEMNKSRQAIAQLADGLADCGIATLLPDLGGTGDSEGEFRDAEWEAWRQDVAAAASWADASGWPVEAILGIRLGCALAADALRGAPRSVSRTVFWAPVADGRAYLTQFLRLRVAASLVADGAGESTGELRSRLEAGESLEISGYALGPRLARQIDGIRLSELISPLLGELWWMEVTRAEPSALSPAAGRAIERARASVARVSPLVLAGEPFWASVEIVVNRRLLDRTLATLGGRS